MFDVHGDEHARGVPYDFAVNVATDPPPRWLTDAITTGLARIGSYPDDRPATAALACRHGRDPADVVVLGGAAEAFTLIARALRPRLALAVHPSFTEPERALHEAGLHPRRLLLAAPFALDPAAVPSAADLVIVGNPTNPTGVLHPREALRSLCREGRTTVIDEAFMTFVPGERETLVGATELPGLVVVRSLTKALAVPGLRAGYLLAPAPLAERLRRAAPRWSVNALALAVIEQAAREECHFEQQAIRTQNRRARLAAALRAGGATRVFSSSANVLLLEMADAVSAYERLRVDHGIATRPGWTFPGLDCRHLRVAVRGQPLDGRLASALAAVASQPA